MMPPGWRPVLLTVLTSTAEEAKVSEGQGGESRKGLSSVDLLLTLVKGGPRERSLVRGPLTEGSG